MPVDYVPETASLYFYSKGEGLGDPCIGIISVKHSETNVILSGAHGKINRADMREMMALLRGKGVKNLYFYRNDRHIAPLATIVEAGPFTGYYEIKMSEFSKRFGDAAK
ncbi:MAG: hypothetical protein K6U74_00120 [Firmicutes bacterium]|nr:hypothetical protein [Bacillota bacterium]